MLPQFRSLLAAVVVCALGTASLTAQAPQRKGPKGPASSGFGPWLEPNRDEPAGMKYRTFASKLAGTDVSYLIYTPPGYDEKVSRRYPVVYFLHGRGGSQSGAAVFASRLDAAIRAGTAPAAFVVGVNGRKTGSWVDTYDGKSPLQSVIVEELIPHIDATYRTIARREARAIEGFSMGGAGAPKIGFKYPDRFGTVGILAGALHDLARYKSRGTAFQDIYGGNDAHYLANDAWSVLEKNAGAIRGRTFVRVAVGGKDNLLATNTAYHELLTKLRIEHEFDVVPDAAHNPGQVYDGLGARTWAFYTRAFARVAAPPGGRPDNASAARPQPGGRQPGGRGLGAATTLFAATREPVACIVDSAAAAYAVLGMPMGSLRGKPAGGELAEDQFNKAHALAILEKITAPTLILYGEADPLSRINKTIHDLMQGLNKNVRLEIVPGEHHGMLFRPNDRERGLRAWQTMLEFVAQHLNVPVSARVAGATAAPAAARRAPPARGAAPPRPLPEGVKAIRDLAYVANGHAHQKLDLYLPENATGPLPLLVWIHGGGWAAGDKAAGGVPGTVAHAKRGYAAASLNYRLSGAALFPAQIQDCKAALRWLRAHAREYNLDPNRIGVWGSSAGGHLVALLGTTGATKEFDVGAHHDQSSAVQAVCDYFGPTDLLQMDAHALPGARFVHDDARSPESRLVGGPIQEKPYRDLAARVNPIPYVARNAPPFLIVHGDQDPLVPHHQSELLFAALKRNGTPVRFHTIHGAGHGNGFGGTEISDMVAAFFDLHLLGQKTAAAAWPVAMQSDSAASGAPPAARSAPAPAAGASPPARGGQGGGQRPTWPQFLERADANRDGKVTRDEYKGPPPIFERLDRNRDLVITQAEYEQGGAPR